MFHRHNKLVRCDDNQKINALRSSKMQTESIKIPLTAGVYKELKHFSVKDEVVSMLS